LELASVPVAQFSLNLIKVNFMAITIIIVVLIALGVYLLISYKGSKESKNKPPEVK
jgi:hypothetical protein